VVLAAFAAGLVIGALGMVPRWWKHRNAAARTPRPDAGTPPATVVAPRTPTNGL
jgi:putative membrane protein